MKDLPTDVQSARRAKLGTEQSYGRPSSDVLELNTLYIHVDAFNVDSAGA